jgi:hypothetical protein
MNGKKGHTVSAVTESEQTDDLFKFTVSLKISEKQLAIDIDDKLRIPSIDVLTPQKACNMMAENAALHARWNVLANAAAVDADYEKIAFEVWVKSQSKTYRSELAESAGRRITDKQVEEAVLADPEYLRKYRDYLKTRENAANLKSIAMGFGERGERLVNITSMMKWEKPTSTVGKRGRGAAGYQDDEETEKAAFTDSKNDDDDDDN